ncbi:hypothetical protein LX32DRAFT_145280 [Colletotrichum zoysiae]|uniref:Uncharacterized protein n=1 Tax=Colletotrichum zoysiae TaxID=1216348 RepID=A0AAD9LZ70_9PEZI|nr:hypothetical protein LX32DRAFT_145280 [Colletotrichum zoysiae]
MDTKAAPETRRSERPVSMIAVSVSSLHLVHDVYGVCSHRSRPQLHNGNSRIQDEYLGNTCSLQDGQTLSYEVKVNRVHEVCLQATQRYVEERRTNLRMRVAPTTMYHFRLRCRYPRASFRFVPYATSRQNFGSLSSTASEMIAGVAEASTESLPVNIGRICDGVWAQAQRDRLCVPGTEKAAVVNMRPLLAPYEIGNTFGRFLRTGTAHVHGWATLMEEPRSTGCWVCRFISVCVLIPLIIPKSYLSC